MLGPRTVRGELHFEDRYEPAVRVRHLHDQRLRIGGHGELGALHATAHRARRPGHAHQARRTLLVHPHRQQRLIPVPLCIHADDTLGRFCGNHGLLADRIGRGLDRVG
jgi:hypothetical protein